jgi:hypothetical protein
MDVLVQIAPECPVCRAHHTQSFTRDELREQLKQQPLELYCPRFDKRWPVAAEHLEGLLRAIGSPARRSDATAVTP